MKSFFQICNSTTEKLGRKLQEDEVKFLQWMYERYTKEQLETELKQKDCYLYTMNS
ncbi:hypothetical protein [Oceanobacillus massiliensis]|uniref:hypothetical protein n=1 Tax=Oceanobacillus massiliensis TaxID=1465765 RepID=UPI00028A0786|nr:hypothetical protein [Oceanobacillus massiliensis]